MVYRDTSTGKDTHLQDVFYCVISITSFFHIGETLAVKNLHKSWLSDWSWDFWDFWFAWGD